jgi:predicted lipoprotein with Yx(FWY)xxD motif
VLAVSLMGAAAAVVFAAPAPASAASSKHALTVDTAKVSKIGTVLTTSSGRTLYHYTSDPMGQATCTGACAKVWPQILLPKGDTKIKAPKGIKGLDAIHVAGGRLQLAINGEALYRFSGDSRKGQAKGQGVEGTWFAVLKSGASSAPSTAAAQQTGTTTSTTATKSTSAQTPATKSTSTSTTAKSGVTSTTTAKSPSSPAPTTPAPTTPAPTTPTPTTQPPTPTTTPTTTAPTPPPSGGYGY